MKRIAILLGLSLLVAGCANNVTGLTRQILRIQIQTQGPILTTNPAVKYYFVVNTAGITDGPRAYGPWPFDRPRLGWHLPFYLSSETFTYTGTVPLLPVRFTDYFVLSSEAGVPQVRQGRLTGPTDPQGNPTLPPGGLFTPQTTLIENFRILQQGQDWNVAGNTWSLFISKSDLSVIPDNGTAPISANLITTNSSPDQGDQIIDRWTLSPNDFFTLQTTPGELSRDQKFRSILRPENKPTNIEEASVNLSLYQVEVRDTR